MKYFVYAIKSKTRTYIYVGLTNNFDRRFAQHNSGKERTTRPYVLFDVLLLEEFPDRISARNREKYLKSGIGREFLKNLRISLR